MKYLDTKEDSIEDSVIRVLMGEAAHENGNGNGNGKKKKLDPVNKDALKKDFDDRKDKDIDNDGDVDDTDEYLHKRRKAVDKAIKGDKKGDDEMDETMTPAQHRAARTRAGLPARPTAYSPKEIEKMAKDPKYKGNTSGLERALRKYAGRRFDNNAFIQKVLKKHAEMNEAMSGRDVAKRMMKIQTMKGFANKVAKMKTVSRDDLEKMLPDYIDGGDITKVLKEGTWAMPDTPKLKMGLKKALQRPIMLGKEGDDATDTIRSFIGDDELYDDLYAAGMKNPKGDARPIIKKAMKRLGIKEEVELDENFRKLAMMGIGTETKRGARVGLTTDYYLPDNGDKSTGKIIRVSKDGYEIENDGDLTPRLKGKIHKFKFYDPTSDKTSVRGMRRENYEIGNDYAKHTLRVTPGQSENDVDEMLGIAQKKNMSMREALAKVWGLDEGKNPFKKENMKVEKKKMGVGEKKTMTGKEPTEVEVDPKVEKK